MKKTYVKEEIAGISISTTLSVLDSEIRKCGRNALLIWNPSSRLGGTLYMHEAEQAAAVYY